MPCNSDYLEPSEREQQLRRAAKLTVYTPTPEQIEALREYFGGN